MTARLDRPPIYRQTPRRKSQLAKVEKSSVAERHAAARPKLKTGSPYVPYFEIPFYGEAVTTKEPIANFALRQSRTPKNIQSGGKNALFCKLPNTIFSAYLRDTPPVHASYRRVSREIASAHMFISALAPAAASLFAPVAPRDAPKTANVCRGGAHHYFRGNVQRVAPPSRSPGPSAARAGSA